MRKGDKYNIYKCTVKFLLLIQTNESYAKRLLYSTAVLAALALGSCSNDETLNGGLPETTGTNQVIEISVANAGSGLTTRAGRPLLSSEAKQTIENVKIIVCDESGNIKADTLITDWTTVSEAYNDASGHGQKVRFTLGKANALEQGTTYTVYAFGYHGKDSDTPYDSQYTVGEQSTALNEYLKTVGNGQKWDNDQKKAVEDNTETVKTFSENFTIKNTSVDNAEELFAGSAEITVDENGNFSQGVTLHRQVAGMFTYAYNVPYFKDAKYLKVYASQENQALVLGSFYSKVLGNNGTNNVLENVVNGTDTQDTETLLYQIDLTQWFKDIVDVNNDGIIDTYGYTNNNGVLEENSTANWQKPTTGDKFTNVTLVKGSVFGGEFLIPFKAKSNTQTLTLKLTNESGTTLRTWTIKLPSTQVISSGTLTSWNSTSGSGSWSTENSVTETQETYSILRNHLYGIGKKTAEGDGTDDKEDPDGPDGPDNPQDLTTKQDILLQVNDNWEMIHQMEVD